MSRSLSTANHDKAYPFIIIFISLIIAATNGQYNSTLAIRCENTTVANNDTYFVSTYDIPDTTANSTIILPTVQIPINFRSNYSTDIAPDLCYIYILLSDEGALAFDPESKCELSIEIQEGETPNPTTAPTKNPSSPPTKSPTVNPSLPPTEGTPGPTASPIGEPTLNPSKTPTAFPTKAPSKSPTSNPSNMPTTTPTKAPTSIPPTTSPSAVTQPPTAQPTKDPTESKEIDLDEILMWNIFNVNNENLLWINGYKTRNDSQTNPYYFFSIYPGCNSSAASNEMLGARNITTAVSAEANLLYENVEKLAQKSISSTELMYNVSGNAYNTKLFPTKVTIDTHDTGMTSSASFSIMNDTKTPDIVCNYKDPFETKADDDNTTRGIEYFMFPVANINGSLYLNDLERKNLTLDIIISRKCVGDTKQPTTSPTTSPSDDDTFLWGLTLPVFIIVVSVGGVCVLAIIAIIICLICTAANRDDDDDDDDDFGPETGTKKEKTEMVVRKKVAKFVVTQEDHDAMLAKQQELSVTLGGEDGLQT